MNELKIYLVNLKNKKVDEIIRHYQEFIKVDDIKKMNKYKYDLRKMQFITSTALKNKYIKDDIYYNEHGKPLSKNIYFNISHSHNLVAFIISNKYEVGIDIELIKDNVKDKLINYVCNDEEIKEIRNDNNKFYYCWTRKEAVLKCSGKGIIKDLKNVLDNHDYYLYSDYINDYVYSVAVNTKEEIKISIKWDYE